MCSPSETSQTSWNFKDPITSLGADWGEVNRWLYKCTRHLIPPIHPPKKTKSFRGGFQTSKSLGFWKKLPHHPSISWGISPSNPHHAGVIFQGNIEMDLPLMGTIISHLRGKGNPWKSSTQKWLFDGKCEMLVPWRVPHHHSPCRIITPPVRVIGLEMFVWSKEPRLQKWKLGGSRILFLLAFGVSLKNLTKDISGKWCILGPGQKSNFGISPFSSHFFLLKNP